MISIRKAASDLDRLEVLLQTVTQGYDQGLRAVAQYALEFDAGETGVFRGHLSALQEKISAAATPEDWNMIQASFRGELRDYRDRCDQHLQRMCSEVGAAAEAMQLFANCIAATSTDQDDTIQNALGKLDSLTSCNSIAAMKDGIHEATVSIAKSLEALRGHHQMAVAQLRDEIRILHERIEVELRAVHLDASTGVSNRQRIESRIAELLQEDRPFCILMVYIRGTESGEGHHAVNLVDGARRALLQRMQRMLGEHALLGRWTEDHFVAILTVDIPAAMVLSREASSKLTGNYSIQENGLSKRIPLQARAGIVERKADQDSLIFHERLSQMARALSGQSS